MTDRAGPVAAIVLAAGRASRIGRPKALLPIGGETVLRRVVRACREGGAAPIHIVTGHAAPLIESEARGDDVTIIRNYRFPDGQLSSLQAGIASLPGGIAAILLFPVDYPLVTAEVPRLLIRAFRTEGKGGRVFVPTFEGREGRPYLVDAALTSEYLALDQGRIGREVARADRGRIREVPVSERSILLDLDTPEDYARIRALHRESTGSPGGGQVA